MTSTAHLTQTPAESVAQWLNTLNPTAGASATYWAVPRLMAAIWNELEPGVNASRLTHTLPQMLAGIWNTLDPSANASPKRQGLPELLAGVVNEAVPGASVHWRTTSVAELFGMLAGAGSGFDLASDIFGNGLHAGFDYTDLDITKVWGPDQVGLLWQSQAITPVSASTQTVGVALNKERQLAGVPNWTGHNLALWSNTFDHGAPWQLLGTPSIVGGVADPDDGTAAYTVIATGANDSVYQGVTAITGQPYTGSIWVRRRTGSGAIRIIVPDNSGNQVIAVTSSWQQFPVTTAGTNPAYVGVQIATSGDAIDIYIAQMNRGTVATTGVATTTLAGFQAVNAALQPTAGFRPAYTEDGARKYWLFDGSDDGLFGPTVMPGTDMTLIASVVGNALSAGTDIILGCADAGPTNRCQLGIVDGVPAGGWGAHSVSTITGGSDIRGLNRTLLLRANASVVELWDMAADGTLTRIYQGAPSGTATTANALAIGANNAAGTLSSFFNGQIGAALVTKQFLTEGKIRGAMQYCAGLAFP